MLTSRDGLLARWRLAGTLRVHAAPHAVPVLLVGLATVVGALAAFIFQVISARAIGPQDFGLLAAFLAILNVAAVASSALQNTVAVQTAEVSSYPAASTATARRGPSDATMLGLGGAIVVAAFTPVLVRALDATPMVVLLAAAAIPLSFWLAEAVGVLQGAGRSVGAVWWTTISLLARVALMLVVLALGLGIGGVLAAVLLGTGAAVVGAGVPARRLRHAGRGVFARTGVTVLLLSLVFAWLANSDVIILRATAPGVAAGNFASAAVLVKAAFLLPATLSVYLLPRFVRNRRNRRLVRLGERVSVAVTAVSGVTLALVFWSLGDQIARLIYGPAFAQGGELLFPLSLAYLPWITAQSVLIRLTAHASLPAFTALVVAAVLQVTGFVIAAPDVTAVIWVQAVVGAAVLAAFLDLVRRLNRPSALD